MNDTPQPRRFGIIPADAPTYMTGLEILQAMKSGEFPTPPICEALNFELTEVEYGRIVFVGHPAYAHYNPVGGVHGGYSATLLDSCMTCAVQTHLPVGISVTTLEFKINFVRGFTDAIGSVRAEGTTISVGRRIGIAEGRMVDSTGKLLVHASTTCLVFEAGANAARGV